MELKDVVSKLVEEARDKRTAETRASKRVSATAIAIEMGIPQPTLHRICDGTTKKPKSDVIRKLTAYFKVSLKELFGDTPIPDDWEAPDRADMTHEERAEHIADGIRNMLLAAGFGGDGLGSKEEIIARLTGDVLHTKPMDHDLHPDPTPQDNDDQPQSAGRKTKIFGPSFSRKKKSPKHGEGDG